MALEIRKLGIILAVAILFAIFVFAVANAFAPAHNYPSTCLEANQSANLYPPTPYKAGNCTEIPPPTQAQINACPGRLTTHYNGSGCADRYVCSCSELTMQFDKQDRQFNAWFGAILGALAIVAGMLLPRKKEINDWIGTGFILGGLIAMFWATAIYWSDFAKWAKPVVIGVELVLILWLAYKRFGPDKRK